MNNVYRAQFKIQNKIKCSTTKFPVETKVLTDPFYLMFILMQRLKLNPDLFVIFYMIKNCKIQNAN